MDLEGIRLSKINEREKQIPYDFTYMWNLRNKWTNKKKKQKTKKKNRLINTETKLMVARGGGRMGETGGGIKKYGLVLTK